MTTNKQKARCRRCNAELAPTAGVSIPAGLPDHVGYAGREYACERCYKWMVDYLVAYRAAQVDLPLIGEQITRLQPELVQIIRNGRREEVHSQAAAWALVNRALINSELDCDLVARTLLDHLVIKAPATYQNFKTTVAIAVMITHPANVRSLYA